MKQWINRDFPGGPVAKTPMNQFRGPGLILAQKARSHMSQLGVRMPHATYNLRSCIPQRRLKIPSAATKTGVAK